MKQFSVFWLKKEQEGKTCNAFHSFAEKIGAFHVASGIIATTWQGWQIKLRYESKGKDHALLDITLFSL